jgi:hypothetical protein
MITAITPSEKASSRVLFTPSPYHARRGSPSVNPQIG